MICVRCATPIPQGGISCPSCGAEVSGSSGGPLRLEIDPGLQDRVQDDLGGEYVIEGELGRGGMAVVYLAHEADLDRKVAIKVLPPQLRFGGQGWVERFKREARTAATLAHPNIIPIHRVGSTGVLVWYAMQYIEGESLERLLEREWQLSVERTTEIVRQVAAALDYAHQRGVIHRDIKPANVMLDPRGWVTVTDFGIAKAIGAGVLTHTGSTIGTPQYMSPEQCAGSALSGASDQYALGVMTYQMLGGRVPFTGESVVEIIKKHTLDPVPPLGKLRASLPAGVVAVVERALAKSPDSRFPSAGSFAKALELAAAGVDVAAGEGSAAWREAETVLVAPLGPGQGRPAPRGGRAPGRRAAWSVLGVLSLAFGGLLWSQLATRERLAEPPPAVGQPGEPAGAAPQDTTVGSVAAPVPRRVPRPAADSAGQERAPGAAGSESVRTEAAPAFGSLTVGTRPHAVIYVNGRPHSNPISALPVRAGTVRLQFQVTDSTGYWWAPERQVVVRPGEHVRLRWIELTRP